MISRKFGGCTLNELKELRKNPADGAKFYMALLAAAPDFFQLAGDVEQLEVTIGKLVSILEDVADKTEGQDSEALDVLRETLTDPAIKKIIASR